MYETRLLRAPGSIRARLAALALVGIVPLIGLFAWNAWKVHSIAIAQAQDDIARLARLAAQDTAGDIRAARNVLLALSSHPDVRAGRDPGCGDVLRAQKAAADSDFAVFDGTGWLLCHSAAGVPANRFAGDRGYFAQALETRSFIVGQPVISRLDASPVLPVALPVLDAAGEVSRVVVNGLDLRRLGERLGAARAMDGVAFTILDAADTILYRYPDNERWAGKRYSNFQPARLAGVGGTLEAAGLDGVVRVYAVETLKDYPDAGLYFTLGIARSELTASADGIFFRSLGGLGLIGFVVLALGGLLADRYLRRPVAALDEAQRRLAAGDLAVRVPSGSGSGELERLARGFNSTATALQRAERAMRVLSDSNRALLRAQAEQGLLDAVCRIAVQTGGYRMAYFGYAEYDAAKSVRIAASNGASREFTEAIRASWADEPTPCGPTGRAIRTGGLAVVRDIHREAEGAPWRTAMIAEGLTSALSLPVRVNGEVVGALTILAVEQNAFDEREVGLLGELADDLGFGIQTLRLRERHADAEREIRELVDNLERRVAERTAEIADLYDNAPCGYHSVDENGLIVRMNDTWLRWLGYSREEVVGRKHHPDLMTPESARRFRDEYFPLFRKQGWLKEVEFEYVRKDGSTFPGSLQTSSLHDAQGRFVMSRTMVFDITERKRIEAELARKNAELTRANEMKSQFLATMSHELRTPLNAIIGFAEVLKDGLAGDLPAEQKSFVQDIHASGRHLLSLINDILDLSKIEAGMMTLDREPVDLAALLRGSVTIVKERAMKHRVSLQVEIEPGLPVFSADPRKLKQIAYNLLSNAVKFTAEGGQVCVSARRVARSGVRLPAGPSGRMGELPDGEAAEFVELAVTDSGIGIGEGDLERLFRPFVQIDSALSRRHEGTGLGLAMVLRLAELHGGTAGVASEPGRGSTFLVWLPISAESSRLLPVPAPVAVAVAVARAPAVAPLALIVEDDDDAAAMIERVLRAEGFRCRRAATGEEGLVRAGKERPDLITLDVFLPHMDGWEFLARVKASPEIADIPVVIVSVASNLEHGMALGARRVLQKPFSKSELRAALAGIVPVSADETPRTVLIVDDNPQAVEILAGYLAEGNCRLLRAYGGREAVEAASRNRPDLILLDLMMPEVSGFDVVERLKADPATAEIPIVVITAKDVSAEERAMLNGSVERIVAKAGLEAKDFVAEVRRAMRQAPGAA